MSIKKKGNFNGKLGNTVTYMLNGREVQRGIGVRVKPPTIAELTNCMKMSLTNELHQPVLEFLEVGYALEGKEHDTTARNRATSYNKKNALTGIYPDVVVDFSKVLFSRGALPVNPEFRVEVRDGGLAFSWNPVCFEEGMRENDSVLMLAYCSEKESAFMELNGHRRSDAEDFLPITAYHQPVTLEVYAAFVSANRKSISNSVHIGQVKF